MRCIMIIVISILYNWYRQGYFVIVKEYQLLYHAIRYIAGCVTKSTDGTDTRVPGFRKAWGIQILY